MYSFRNDYSEGAHPQVLDALIKSNLEQTDGYGLDPYCERARGIIAEKAGCPEADIHFLVGGTQSNLTVIASALRPYQAVISAHTGHICVHETGAIEATGHKVIAMPSDDGKLTPAMIEQAVSAHVNEHMVQPKMAYISHPSEIGTIYSKAELEALLATCNTHGLYLFIDGARLASALVSPASDVTLRDLAHLADVFYIGGTKCGAMFGEALVITHETLKTDFRYMMKQRGGMLAKGRLLGIQFAALLEDGLYEQLGAHANRLAFRIRDAFCAAGYKMLSESFTNQQFPILPDAMVEQLAKHFKFETERKMDDGYTAIRFVTSWATREDAVDALVTEIASTK